MSAVAGTCVHNLNPMRTVDVPGLFAAVWRDFSFTVVRPYMSPCAAQPDRA